MANIAAFHAYGITLNLPDGPVTLAAGPNITILPQGNLVTISAQTPANAVINSQTAWLPPSISDAKAPNGSVYFSTNANKLVFKDSSGTVHNLY